MTRTRVITEEGDRVIMVGSHPWVGYSGIVVTKTASGSVTVELDNGIRSIASPRQYKKVAVNHSSDGGQA